MLLTEPHLPMTDGCLDLSLNEPDRWGYPEGMGVANGTYVHVGDEERGPVMFVFAVAPGVALPESPAHGHASDNWRMSLRGTLPMGRERYGPGDFRLQEGWKPYGSDSMSTGPDGGWAALIFGDRRGTKIRPVREDSGFPDEHAIAEWAHLTGDQVSDDPTASAGPAALATTAGKVSGARVNGSFAVAHDWPTIAPGVNAVAAVLGDRTLGPFLLHVHAASGTTVAPAGVAATEIVRLVVSGACSIGPRTYVTGDIRIQAAGAASEAVIAGPDGVQMVALYGDRRHLVPTDALDPLSKGLREVLAELHAQLPTEVAAG